MKGKGLLPHRHRLDGAAQGPHASLLWCQQTIEELQQGRFATPVDPQERNLLAVADLQIDAVKGQMSTLIAIAHPAQPIDDSIRLEC
ncbi:hypothetical protein A4R35_16795 [Thermogemmatispora tikiterensis]|uniref:Uncharacterized protein n=1 Tax=Thermogemmatispora tikiterensis TaxID=1825093 RepID=A0A328VJF0_9CHLR|nr:hypothetical protein A4R35_16795 [Thermogemmatispora tikiterensis]